MAVFILTPMRLSIDFRLEAWRKLAFCREPCQFLDSFQELPGQNAMDSAALSLRLVPRSYNVDTELPVGDSRLFLTGSTSSLRGHGHLPCVRTSRIKDHT